MIKRRRFSPKRFRWSLKKIDGFVGLNNINYPADQKHLRAAKSKNKKT